MNNPLDEIMQDEEFDRMFHSYFDGGGDDDGDDDDDDDDDDGVADDDGVGGCYCHNLAGPEGGPRVRMGSKDNCNGLVNRLLRWRFKARLAMYLV
jgi:hypothetical protein